MKVRLRESVTMYEMQKRCNIVMAFDTIKKGPVTITGPGHSPDKVNIIVGGRRFWLYRDMLSGICPFESA
jgi:hypothetical protein